jgi:hypothetical protein
MSRRKKGSPLLILSVQSLSPFPYPDMEGNGAIMKRMWTKGRHLEYEKLGSA